MIQVHFLGRKVLENRPFDIVEDQFNACFMLVLADTDSRCPKFRTQVPWLSYQHHKHLFHDKKANQVTPAVSARTDVGGVDWLSSNMFDP